MRCLCLQIEVHLSCELSVRQKRLYHGLRQRISIEDLLQSSHSLSSHSHLHSHSHHSSRDSSLLNLVMQFRKVRVRLVWMMGDACISYKMYIQCTCTYLYMYIHCTCI